MSDVREESDVFLCLEANWWVYFSCFCWGGFLLKNSRNWRWI